MREIENQAELLHPSEYEVGNDPGRLNIIMLTLDRILVLNTLIKHETLKLPDLGKEENLGMVPNEHQLLSLLDGLEYDRLIEKIDGAVPCTYTVTCAGIAEGKRLKAL